MEFEGFKERNRSKHISSFKIIILGFFCVIVVGAGLLMLPISSVDHTWTNFLDCMFTAVSATCVTGLAVFNTAEHWSFFGQLILLILIQIGGMGIITVAIAISMVTGKKIGIGQRSLMQESISAHQVGGIIKMMRFIIQSMVIIELFGAICLAPTMIHDYGVLKGIWYSVFHSVSAFCNAGFDLLGDVDGNSSLMKYMNQPQVIIPIIFLILTGGIGFITWDDFKQYKLNFRKYHMQSKVVLITSIVLIVVPWIFYYFYEFGPDHWEGLTVSQRILASLFQTVTPRTAGFYTVNLSQMTDQGKLVMILLMLVGGSSGSTAGGIKMTTVAVLFMSMIAVFRKKADVQCFGRRLAKDSIYNACAIVVLYVGLFLMGGTAISIIENQPLMDCLFESASAVATVGLTLGITSTLGVASKIILMAMMFLGRVGGLTLIFAIVNEKRPINSKFPEEQINVG